MQELVLDEVYDVWWSSFWNTVPGYLTLVSLAVGIIVLSYGIVKIVMRYRQETMGERTMRNLKKLAERADKGSLDPRKVYHELTTLIKNYAHWRFKTPRGVTDYELTVLLTQVGSEKEQQRAIERITSDAQAVKFGKVDVLKRQIQRDIADSISFVEHTRQIKE